MVFTVLVPDHISFSLIFHTHFFLANDTIKGMEIARNLMKKCFVFGSTFLLKSRFIPCSTSKVLSFTFSFGFTFTFSLSSDSVSHVVMVRHFFPTESSIRMEGSGFPLSNWHDVILSTNFIKKTNPKPNPNRRKIERQNYVTSVWQMETILLPRLLTCRGPGNENVLGCVRSSRARESLRWAQNVRVSHNMRETWSVCQPVLYPCMQHI